MKTSLINHRIPDTQPHVITHVNDLLGQSKKEGTDQETIQSSTTPDPGHHMGKYIKIQ